VQPADPPAREQVVDATRQLRDEEAATYDDHIRRRRGWMVDVQDAVTRDALDLDAEHVVIDAGCGTGRHLPWLAATAARVIAIDYSAASLDVARGRLSPPELARIEFHAADVRRLPVETGVANRALLAEVMGDLPAPEQRLEAIRELHRVLRPGGVAVALGWRWLIAARRRDGEWSSGLRYHTFTPGELRRLFRAAGFEEVAVGGTPLIPDLAQRLHLSPGAHVRAAFTPVGRALGRYAVVRARRET
jgi:SAM-dependent methyltransferase